jgi:energy-converting hydrogenase Eha subunit A
MASNGMDRGWYLSAGGGCSIWAGISLILSGVALVVSGEYPSGFSYMVSQVFPTYMGVPLIVLGIIAIVGGVSAIRRGSFGLSLAGAICGLPSPFWILAILAVIFVAMGKREFGAES